MKDFLDLLQSLFLTMYCFLGSAAFLKYLLREIYLWLLKLKSKLKMLLMKEKQKLELKKQEQKLQLL